MNSDRERWTETRRENLRRYVELHCDGNIAEMIRRLDGKHGNDAYWRAVVSRNPKVKKSFSMEKATEIEPPLGLVSGELLKENSELRLDPARMKSFKQEAALMLERMTPEEHLAMVNYGAKLIRQRIEDSKPAPSRLQNKSRRAGA